MNAIEDLIRALPPSAMDDPDVQRLLSVQDQAWATFRPRPDQPERYDQQTAFYNSSTTGVAWMLGGNGAGTTTVTLAKVAKFLLETPAPRKNTPFWVIATSYEQVMETCWVEKLNGQGFIPDNVIDWDRISWYKSSRGWPFAVPLKPQHGETGNWVIEFKSCEQGRKEFQARAIGGFAFIEQFPYSILMEVLRGCRVYNFPGSKFCEFTPIDPAMSMEIEEMIENGFRPKEGAEPGRRYMPETWEVYRANTRCAMEAGHVTKSWYEEFFGMIPDEMRETRETGAFASYEGVIYKGFIPSIHLIEDDRVEFPFPGGVQHRRGLDWGAGPQNATCCLYAYRNNRGQWFIYDEYYSTDQEATTVDHLMRVADRWKWPVNHPNYGVTWADHDIDNIRIASQLPRFTEQQYDPIPMAMAKKAIREGIEWVRYLLKPSLPVTDPATGQTRLEPRLFIHKRRCPNLARQFKTYRWLQSSDSGLNPRNPAPEPLDKDNHAVDACRYVLFSEADAHGQTIESTKNREGDGRAIDRVRPLERIPQTKIIPGGKR